MRAAKPVNFWRLRQYLSYRPGQTFGMRINICQRNWDRDIQTITTFGQAQLIRRVDGRLELCGGSRSDHTAAKEWISLFMHEAVPLVRCRDQEGRADNLQARRWRGLFD